MKSMEKFIGYILSFALVGGLLYGIWQIERKINFTFSYEDQVKQVMNEEINPKIEILNQKITDLQKRIAALEAKAGEKINP